MAKAKIGVLGTGDVGRVLGAAFIQLGHEVKIGSRDAKNEKAQAWVKEQGARASAGTFADAAKFGEILVLATLWDGTENALKIAGAENCAGKIVIDCTNPIRFVKQGQPPVLTVGHEDSAGEQVQRWLPKAKVVKAFNAIGNPHMFKPTFPGGPPTHFIAGNDEGARKTVTGILQEFGWEVVDLGGIEASRYLEPLAMVWITHLFRNGFNGNHAFKLLRK